MGAAQSNGLRVLIVEDNSDTADSLAILLKIRGATVQVARSGPDAVTLAGVGETDVVLLDIGLPGMDGFTVARRIRELPLANRPRLIAVSGYGQAEDIRRSAAAGIDIHLVKPVEPDDLFRILYSSGNGDSNKGHAPMPAAERRTGHRVRQGPSDFGLATATLPGRLFRWWAYGRRIEAVTGATRWHIDHVAAFCRSVRRIFLDRPAPIL